MCGCGCVHFIRRKYLKLTKLKRKRKIILFFHKFVTESVCFFVSCTTQHAHRSLEVLKNIIRPTPNKRRRTATKATGKPSPPPLSLPCESSVDQFVGF